ncbi:MAG TPA: FAD-dependent oxidoreductase [Terriglobales bacterium]|nr:FAD-dependent oxidoreductase [Terriglobales bacterium]
MQAESTIRADVAVIGAGLGGCAAALAAARTGRTVILTEDTRWIGGQLTSQAVPPDEHPWMEHFGATASYRELRTRIRDYYRAHLPLTAAARNIEALNPGNGFVSGLCHDPRVALAVLKQMLAPYELNGKLRILCAHRPVKAWTHRDRVAALAVTNLQSGHGYLIEAPFFVDGTALGDVLALAGAEHITGAESNTQTGEPHAPDCADPLDQQAVTFCFAMEYLPGEDHTIDKPRDYEFWRNHRPEDWPGPLLSWRVVRPPTLEPLVRPLFEEADGYSWWTYRRILDRSNFEEGFAASDVTLVDWPQNDYRRGPLCGVDEAVLHRNLAEAKQLSLSLLYWLQVEAPRPDGGLGYPGLRLRADVVGETEDGLAMAPYIRSSRRIRAEFTVLEQHIAYPLQPSGPTLFADSVGVGCYRIDLHPRTNGRGYLDLGSWPFQIPLGSLLPVRLENLLPGGKNLGTTHITNGAFRVHPVEWNVGEVAGLLASFCLERHVEPRFVRSHRAFLEEFQSLLRNRGIELCWPSLSPV